MFSSNCFFLRLIPFSQAKVPKHFKELVKGELVFISVHTKKASDEPVKKKRKNKGNSRQALQVLAIGTGWRRLLLEQAKRIVKKMCLRGHTKTKLKFFSTR